jgi:flagellar biosynthesis chaperone FliJ
MSNDQTRLQQLLKLPVPKRRPKYSDSKNIPKTTPESTPEPAPTPDPTPKTTPEPESYLYDSGSDSSDEPEPTPAPAPAPKPTPEPEPEYLNTFTFDEIPKPCGKGKGPYPYTIKNGIGEMSQIYFKNLAEDVGKCNGILADVKAQLAACEERESVLTEALKECTKDRTRLTEALRKCQEKKAELLSQISELYKDLVRIRNKLEQKDSETGISEIHSSKRQQFIIDKIATLLEEASKVSSLATKVDNYKEIFKELTNKAASSVEANPNAKFDTKMETLLSAQLNTLKNLTGNNDNVEAHIAGLREIIPMLGVGYVHPLELARLKTCCLDAVTLQEELTTYRTEYVTLYDAGPAHINLTFLNRIYMILYGKTEFDDDDDDDDGKTPSAEKIVKDFDDAIKNISLLLKEFSMGWLMRLDNTLKTKLDGNKKIAAKEELEKIREKLKVYNPGDGTERFPTMAVTDLTTVSDAVDALDNAIPDVSPSIKELEKLRLAIQTVINNHSKKTGDAEPMDRSEQSKNGHANLKAIDDMLTLLMKYKCAKCAKCHDGKIQDADGKCVEPEKEYEDVFEEEEDDVVPPVPPVPPVPACSECASLRDMYNTLKSKYDTLKSKYDNLTNRINTITGVHIGPATDDPDTNLTQINAKFVDLFAQIATLTDDKEKMVKQLDAAAIEMQVDNHKAGGPFNKAHYDKDINAIKALVVKLRNQIKVCEDKVKTGHCPNNDESCRKAPDVPTCDDVPECMDLRKEVAALSAIIVTLNAALAKCRADLEDCRASLKDCNTKLADMTADRDEWKRKCESGSAECKHPKAPIPPPCPEDHDALKAECPPGKICYDPNDPNDPTTKKICPDGSKCYEITYVNNLIKNSCPDGSKCYEITYVNNLINNICPDDHRCVPKEEYNELVNHECPTCELDHGGKPKPCDPNEEDRLRKIIKTLEIKLSHCGDNSGSGVDPKLMEMAKNRESVIKLIELIYRKHGDKLGEKISSAQVNSMDYHGLLNHLKMIWNKVGNNVLLHGAVPWHSTSPWLRGIILWINETATRGLPEFKTDAAYRALADMVHPHTPSKLALLAKNARII